MYVGTWNGLLGGSVRFKTGTSTMVSTRRIRKTCQPRRDSSLARRDISSMVSSLRGPALEREQAARPLLDEQDDEDQDQDLAEHGAGIGFQELVEDAERHGAGQYAPQAADPTEHHDHEAVHDVALPQVGADIADLAERHAGDTGDAGPKPEGHRVDPTGAD